MKPWVFTCLLAMALLPTIAAAQSPPSGCAVAITAPTAGAQVGGTGQVKGTATVPTGHRLWVFAHMQGLSVVWPQGGGSANINNGSWQVVAYFGLPRDIGQEFEVAAAVVDATVNQRLEDWVKTSAASGQFVGIPMPNFVAGCLSTVTVKKTS